MDKKDIMEISEDKMGFLLTMKHWFIVIENIEGPFVAVSYTHLTLPTNREV